MTYYVDSCGLCHTKKFAYRSLRLMLYCWNVNVCLSSSSSSNMQRSACSFK